MYIIRMLLTGMAGLMWAAPFAVALFSQQPAGVPAAPPDPQIAAALQDVAPKRIQQTIEKLVSFGTRQTLSSDLPASSGKGANAAAAWIQSEFERYSRECGGCLEVKTDEFTQEPGPRVPKPTKITNVYAVLRGTDPANAGRIVLVTGHYDSRNSDTNDATDPAPGANDDGSGTAVSLECARVLSKHRFPATIIFLTVAGEEQGLYGSAHFAKMAAAQGWNIEAVLNNDIVGGDRTPGNTMQDPGSPTRADFARAGVEDPHVVRVFSEGIPTTADEKQLKTIRALGGENDGPSRQLARYIASVSKEYLPPATFQPLVVFRRDRYLRGGDHSLLQRAGIRGGTAHGIARELQPPAPERSHRERHRIRRPAQVCGLRLHRERGAPERGHAGFAGVRARTAGQRAPVDERAAKRFHYSLGSFAGWYGNRL